MLTRLSKHIVALMTAFTLCVLLLTPVQAHAKEDGGSLKTHAKAKLEISKTKLTIYTNMSQTLKMKDSAQNVKWKSSNRKIVSILGTGNGTATLKSGNKTGSCTITAKADGKSYKCRVTVKKDTKVSRATLVNVKQASKKITLKVKLANKTNEDLWYGNPYYFEKFEDGKWKKVPVNTNVAFTSEAYIIPPKSSVTITFTIENDENAYYRRTDFTPGIYRINIDVIYPNTNYRYVIFELK